jgi:hypothetical protein
VELSQVGLTKPNSHAWPISGRASYSAQNVTTRPPVPYSARKDVESPKAWVVTLMPFESKKDVMLSWALNSAKLSSALGFYYA